MACAGIIDTDKILDVLEKISDENQPNRPHSAASILGSEFKTQTDAKVKALKDSFDPKLIYLRDQSLSDKQDIWRQTTQSPKTMGKKFHQNLADNIKSGERDGIEGEILDAIETTFRCKFIKAEVRISGFAVNEETQHFWKGKMDAVAIRRENDALEVFVVDWKTSDKDDKKFIVKWWENSGNFRGPLYQCLVYRELLQAHFEHKDVDAKVGIILVPFQQSFPERIHPGLCVDFRKMNKNHLLDGLKNIRWYAVLNKSLFGHTIKTPCKLNTGSFNPADYVDESTNILKHETPLKGMLNDDATGRDVRRSLDLPFIKREEKTNEELEEVNKKCLHHVVMTVKFSVLNKPENNQYDVALSLPSFFLLWRAKPTR